MSFHCILKFLFCVIVSIFPLETKLFLYWIYFTSLLNLLFLLCSMFLYSILIPFYTYHFSLIILISFLYLIFFLFTISLLYFTQCPCSLCFCPSGNFYFPSSSYLASFLNSSISILWSSLVVTIALLKFWIYW